ncbi:hypothetical protein GCM10007049_29490 [Echinicola pacifica]|uniref:Uncharacterized protein n=1 Tax=Echinicola pacifica TaxID=346377 RepID=A0A918UUM0_9BACT|nr:hypothetical protein GCM10007049_29490 [Echinicola pacifica]
MRKIVHLLKLAAHKFGYNDCAIEHPNGLACLGHSLKGAFTLEGQATAYLYFNYPQTK